MTKCKVANKLIEGRRWMLWALVEKLGFTYDAFFDRSGYLNRISGEMDEFLSKNWQNLVKLRDHSTEFFNNMKTSKRYDEVLSVIRKSIWEIRNEPWTDIDKTISRVINDKEAFAWRPLNLEKDEKEILTWIIKQSIEIVSNDGLWQWADILYAFSKNPKLGWNNPIDAVLSETMWRQMTLPIVASFIQDWVKIDGRSWLQEHLRNYLEIDLQWLASKKSIDNFVKDLTWENLFHNKFFHNLIQESRVITSFLKFTAFIGSNIMYAVWALLMWTMNFIAKWRWFKTLEDSKTIDYLLDQESFLWKESKAADTFWVITQNLDSSDQLVVMKAMKKMWLQEVIELISSKWWKLVWMSDEWIAKMQAVMLGWWQVWVDILFESRVKRQAIARALSMKWVNANNLEDFYKKLKNWEIDREFLNDLRWLASTRYNRFYTAGHLLHTTRDRFSRWMAFSFLQHYVTSRSAEMLDGFRKAYLDMKSWVYKDMNFSEYLLERNPELRDFLSSMFTSMSYWYYMGEYMNNQDTEFDDKSKWFTYSRILNDQFSSMSAQLIARTIWWMWKWAYEYWEYRESTWDPLKVMELWEAAIIQFGSQMASSLFRELKVANAFLAAWWLVKEGSYSREMVFSVLDTELDRAINWMWRFWAVPWMEKYLLHKLGQKDDWFSYFAFWLEDTNESISEYYKLKTVEGIQQAISQWVFLNTWNKLQYSALGYWATKFFSGNPSAEAKYNAYTKQLERDLVMQNLLNWKFDKTIMMSGWYLDRTKVNTIYSDLVKFDYSRVSKYIDESWDPTLKWMDKVKDEVFVQQVLEKIWEEEYIKELAEAWYTTKAKWLRKILLMAENEINWSSRVILSYLAKSRYEHLVDLVAAEKWLTWYDATAANLTEEERTMIKANVVETWIPDMHMADKESWFRLLEQRTVDLWIGKWWIDKKKTDYFSTLAFVDFMAHSEWKKLNPDAKYIQNIFAPIGKFIKNDEARINIANYALESINELNTNPDKKLIMKTWVLAGNIDFLNTLMADPDFRDKHSDTIETFLDQVFDVNAELNDRWVDVIKTDIIKDATKKKTWWTDYNKPYYTPTKSDQWVRDKFQKAVPSYNRLPKWYSPKNPVSTYSRNKRFPQTFPEVSSLYWKIQRSLNRAAKSEWLVKGYVRKYPSDFYWHLKWKDQQRVKIRKFKPQKWDLFR